ncbi:hypothetical protein JF66_12205, partial [Cryobacterium sp. MLB-32]|uniref:sensor domain-containing diguanylate cyclase n=1 Tax=Cryobacterium sp. MLB-32 TaxID=1529318 RepID=UPI0004E730F9
MLLDGATLVLVSGLVTVICGISVIANTAFLRSDDAGRVWSIAYISAVMSAVSYSERVLMRGTETWWTLVVGHFLLVVAIGALWSGLRLHNGRRSLLWVVLLVAGAVALAAMLRGTGEHELTATLELSLAAALLSGLGCVEATRAPLQRNLNARILAVAFGVLAFFGLLRVVVFLFYPNLFVMSFNRGFASLVALSFVIVATITISVLRAEQGGRTAVGDRNLGIHSAAGALTLTAFAQASIDHLDRAREREVGLVLVRAEIDNLPAINAAFGRRAGDEAISEFTRMLRAALPVMSLIGHSDSGRFLILGRAASRTDALALTERIRTAMVQNPLSKLSSIRLTASFGIADTFDHGHDFDALRAAADAALAVVRERGGNDAVV